MEIAITVATVLQKIRSTYDLVAAKTALPKQLKNSLSTLLLLEVNATQLIGCNRLPDRSLRCLQEVVALLKSLEQETEAHVSQHKLKRMLKVFSNRPKKILQQIKDVNDRLELLGRIKTLAIESSTFDSANLLKNADSYAVEFWDRFFGSQVYSVAIPDFIMALERENQTRLTTKERRCLEEILDPDYTNNVNVLHFASWIERFGPLNTIVATTISNTLSPHTGKMYPFYVPEAYPEEALDSLSMQQRVVVRNRDTGSFEVFVLVEETLRFNVSRVENGFVVKEGEEDSFIENLLIKNKNQPKTCFATLPELVACCEDVAGIMCPCPIIHIPSPKSNYSSDSSSSSTSSTRSLHANRHRLASRGCFWFESGLPRQLQQSVTEILRKNGYTKRNTPTATFIGRSANSDYSKSVVLNATIPESRPDIIAMRVRDQ